MYLLGLFFSFFSAINLLSFGKILGRETSVLFSCSIIISSWLFSVYYFYEVIFSKESCIVITKEWFQTTICKTSWMFLFDRIAIIMFLVVTTISMFVHIFSSYYLKEDPHVIRFFAYLSIFTFFMLFLVTAGSLMQLVIGWEGVGLTSFLLINFWFTRIEANKAAIKAILINRIGDCGIIFSLGVFYNIIGTFDFLLMKYNINLCF